MNQESNFNNVAFSSAFPFFGDEYFLPKPLVKLPDFEKDEGAATAKKYKKINWLSKTHFVNLIHANECKIRSEELVADGGFLSAFPDNFKSQKFWMKEIQQRVQIPLDGNDTKPYYVERIRFNEMGGLYFMVTGDKTTIDKIAECLNWLGEQGIGTDRSVGNGQFSVSRDVISFNLPESKSGVLLSLYCPPTEERSSGFLDNSRYNLIKRGGYISSPEDENNLSLHKKSVFMFSEGSIFSNYASRKGYILDLNPSGARVKHPVYRDGRAFFLPIIIKDRS
ncbi:MAG: type III-A CRISPR-associated RAMP protein Csm4 [Bacteroidetes bacterium]|nr:type III-A CRISPR-associated RAMP protein Csm4 [Bacteroidota bacterium]